MSTGKLFIEKQTWLIRHVRHLLCQIKKINTILDSPSIETDPVFTASEASNITSDDITNLSNLSGVNTGDQDLSPYQLLFEKGVANGYVPTDMSNKIPIEFIPDSLVGQVEYQGAWDATTNIPNVGDATISKGFYYVTSVEGTYLGTNYQVGDWIISNGVEWQKVDNTDAVTTVFGRIGPIVANSSDYAAFYVPLSSYTAADVMIKLLTVDGSGSGLDADLLDGLHASNFIRTDIASIKTSGDTIFNNGAGIVLGTLLNSEIFGSADLSTYWDLASGNLIIRDGITQRFTFARTTGNFTATGNVTGNSFIKTDGTSSQFLKADGSVDSNSYFSQRIEYAGNINTLSVSAHYGLIAGATNIPSGEVALGSSLIHYQWNADAAKQVFYATVSNNSYWRRKAAGVWGAWQKYWTDTNDGSGSGLDADLLRGVHWGNVNTNIITSGTVTATNFIPSSDERLKKDIKEVTSKAIKTNWKTFELKSEKGQKRYGVIAQELEKEHPEFVRTDNEGMKSVAYIDLLVAKIAEVEDRLKKAGIQ